jgi:hypothetical protein
LDKDPDIAIGRMEFDVFCGAGDRKEESNGIPKTAGKHGGILTNIGVKAGLERVSEGVPREKRPFFDRILPGLQR